MRANNHTTPPHPAHACTCRHSRVPLASSQDDGWTGSCSVATPEIDISVGFTGVASVSVINLPSLKLTAAVDFKICTEPMAIALRIGESVTKFSFSVQKELTLPKSIPIDVDIPMSSASVPVIIMLKNVVEITGKTLDDLAVEVKLTDICVRPEGTTKDAATNICLTAVEAKTKSLNSLDPSGFTKPGDTVWNSVVPAEAKKVIEAFPVSLTKVEAANYGASCKAKPGYGKAPGAANAISTATAVTTSVSAFAVAIAAAAAMAR